MRDLMIGSFHQILVGWSKQEKWDVWGMYGEEDWCIRGFGGETWGKETTLRPRRRWEDNIKTDLQEMGLEDTDWIDLLQNMGRRQLLWMQ